MDQLALFLFKDAVILTVFMFIVLGALSPGLLNKRSIILFWSVGGIANAAWWFVGDAPGISAAIAHPAATIWTMAALITVLTGLPLLVLKGVYLFLRWVRRKTSSGCKITQKSVSGHRHILSGGLLLVISLGISTTGYINALRPFVVHHEEVQISGLPPELDSLTIGQLSDVHVGNFITPQELSEAVAVLNREGVDLQVLTGDLVDDPQKVASTFDALEQCKAKYGMIAVLGNHEKWLCLDEVLTEYNQRAAHGIVHLLVDDSMVAVPGSAPLRVVGVDYPMERGGSHAMPIAKRDVYMEASAKKAFANAREGETVLCLSHHPDFFPFAAKYGAQLTLAGHSHGGQVALFGVPLMSNFRHMLGWYHENNVHLYVSGGFGNWLPFRIGVPRSVTVITLKAL